MKRLAVVISLVLFVLAGPTAHARLSGGDKSKIKKWLATYLELMTAKSADRAGAYEELSKFFADKRKRGDLAGVEDLAELLAHSMVRDSGRTGTVLEGEWTFKKDFGQDVHGRFSYAINVPKKYSGSERSEAWPLIVCLPDKGESPTDYLDSHWANKAIRDKYLIAVLGFDYADITVEKTKTVTEDGKIRIEKYKEKVPFSWIGDGREWPLVRFWRTIVLLQLRDYKVDPNRIILEGNGVGATGALVFASDAAWRFSGVLVRGGEDDRATLQNLAGLRVLSYPAPAATEASKKTVESLKGIAGDGFTAAADAPAWSAAASDAGGEELTKWLDGCTRNRYPVPSKWVRLDPAQQIGYWCAINEVHLADQPAELSIETDKRKNKLLITATNVAKFDIFLNDMLLNLDKPIELYVNEELVDTVTVERSPDQLLSHLFKSAPRDPGAVFTAELLGLTIDAPEAEEGEGGDEDKPEDGGGDKPEDGDKDE